MEASSEQHPAGVPWYRRRRVHIALGLVVALLTAFWAGQRATDGVRANLDSRLRDAGAGTDAALVTLEAEQLSALRAVAFTQGVGQSLATLDVSTLNRLVTPIQGNADVPMVDIVLPDGRVVLAVRSGGAPVSRREPGRHAGDPARRSSTRTGRAAAGSRCSRSSAAARRSSRSGRSSTARSPSASRSR